jgi:hypothetical protein
MNCLCEVMEKLILLLIFAFLYREYMYFITRKVHIASYY